VEHFANSRARNIGGESTTSRVAAIARRGEGAEIHPPSWAAIIARSASRSNDNPRARTLARAAPCGGTVDLDGTLLDYVADIALALNRTMLEYGCKPLARNEVRHMSDAVHEC